MHSYYFKSIIYFILFSFLNMTLSPTVEAMLSEASREGDAHLKRRALPPSSGIPKDAIVFVPASGPQAHGSAPKSPEVLALDSSQIQELRQAFQRIQFAADADFWVSLSGRREADRRKEELHRYTKRAIKGIAGTGALLVGSAITELFIFDGAPGSIMGIGTPGAPIPPIPAALAVAGGAAGFFVLADVYWTFKNGLHEFFRRSSQYDPLAREEDRAKSSLGFVFVAGGIAVFSGKEVFAFITANIGPPSYLLPIIIIAGAPYIFLKVKSAYDTFHEGWDWIWRAGKRWVLNKMGHRIAGEEAKDELRTAFGKAFRKNYHDSEDALDLFISIQAVRSFVEDQSREFLKTLDALKKQHSLKTTSKLEREKIDLQIVKLEAELLNLERLGDLLEFKLMYDYAQGKPSSPTVASADKDPDAPPRKHHPWWDYVTRSTGIVVGGMASGSVWFGYAFMLYTFGAGAGTILTLPSLLAPPTSVYLMKKWGNSFSRIFRFLANYNPIEAEKHISEPAVSYPRFRALMAFLNLARSTYVNLPTSLVGGEGMGSAHLILGEDSYDGPIPLETGLWTLAPSMMGYGAALNEETSRRLADMISSAHMRFGKNNWKENIKQWLATELFRSSEWVDRLKGRNAILLREYMRKEPKDWFTSAIPAGIAPQPPVRGVDVTGIGDDTVAASAVPTDVFGPGEHTSAAGGDGAPVRTTPDTPTDGSIQPGVAEVSGAVATPLIPDVASDAALPPGDQADSALPPHQPSGRMLPPILPASLSPMVIPLHRLGASRSDSTASLLEAVDASSSDQAPLVVLPPHGPRRWAMQALQYLKHKSSSVMEEIAIRISPFARAAAGLPSAHRPSPALQQSHHLRPDRRQTGEAPTSVAEYFLQTGTADPLRQPLLLQESQ